jgi:hypothetical protein
LHNYWSENFILLKINQWHIVLKTQIRYTFQKRSLQKDKND